MNKLKLFKTAALFSLLVFIYIGSVGGCGNNDNTGEGLNGETGGATTLNITNEGDATTVYAQLSGCTDISDWSDISCMTDSSPITTSTITCTTTANNTICSFPIDANQTCSPPLTAGCETTVKVAFNEEFVTNACGSSPGTGPSVAELFVGGDDCSKTPGCGSPPCDCADISLVQGYTMPNISMTLSKDSTVLGPTVGATGNQDVFGVFPVGCTNCVNRGGCPCGIDCSDTSQCHQGGTPNDPDLPCQASQPTGGTVTITILADT